MDRVRNQERSNRGAADDQQLRGLKKYLDVPLLHQESPDDCCKDQNDSYDGEHVSLSGARVVWLPPA
jgi:hypothetical protein